MSDPNTLGSLVRRRRLESGFSLGQLASKVGKTAAEVRAWERDNELPEHGILERLAETLELDLDEIKAQLEAEKQAAAATEESETPKDKEPAESADTDVQAPVAIPAELPEEDPGAESAADEAEPETAAFAEPEEDDDEPGFAVEDPFRPPAAQDDDEFDLLNAPTEAVPVPVITDTAKAARAERAAAVIQEAPPLPVVEAAPDSDPGLLRYLEPLRLLFDPNSRYLYWIRAGLTIVIMLIFAVIFFDQLGKLLDAVGELLDTIEPAATTPDDLDALGSLTG
jgi:transcriptional regulator with XRE-family HTH domain